MVEVFGNLFVGSQVDYESNKSMMNGWAIVHACKEPYHRNLLGYTGRAAPRDDSRYLFGYDKQNNLVLNIVDTSDPSFFDERMMNEAVDFVINSLKVNKKVFIHCNQGESRAPSIALLVLNRLGVYKCSFEEAVKQFIDIYPQYNPKRGIFEYIRIRWDGD